jgi:hypothetical protein
MKNKKYSITIDPVPVTQKPPKNVRYKYRYTLNKIVEVSIDEFSTLIAPPYSFTWTSVFDGQSCSENWISQEVFALDFDTGEISVKEVYEELKKYGIHPQLWYTTFSSSTDLLKFRVVLFLENPITNIDLRQLISKGLLKLFPQADQSCSDAARYYFGGIDVTITSYIPCETNLLLDMSGVVLCSNDFMRLRDVPVLDINSYTKVVAPKWALLYNKYRNYHIRANNNYGTNPPLPITLQGGKLQKVDFDVCKQNIRIFREFLNGKWLYHLELFKLATNLQYTNGGFKLMKDTMIKYNELGITSYTPNNFAILTYLKKVKYPACPIGSFSPYEEDSDLHDLISETKNIRGHIKLLKPIDHISLPEAEELFTSKFKEVMNNDQVGKVYLFRVPTAIGKTEIITSVHATIAAPTNDLKNEIGRRMKFNYKTTPDPIVFENSSINNQMNYYYSIGLPNKSIEVLYSIVNPKNEDQYSIKDIENANAYINMVRDSYTTTSTLLTTHKRAIHSTFSNDTIVFDEDPLKSLVDIKSFKISDLFSVNIIVKSKELEFVIKSLIDTPVMEIRSTPTYNLDLDQLIKEVSQLPNETLKSNLFDFFSSSFYVRDTHKPDIVHYVVKRNIPPLKKIIILSATAPINLYKRLFGERLEVIDISEVQQKGRIIQHTTKSYSRNSLNKNTKDIVNRVGDTPVITFKSYQNHFSNPSNMWFGNCSGYDTLKGKDITVVGTPHINNVVYFLTAKVLGIEFKTSDLSMSYQKVIYNGFEFKFNCFDNENLRMIQFSYIESELIQAVGRARTLRTKANVDLYSNFPLKISSEFRF